MTASTSNYSRVALSKRQTQCLFYLLHGKSAASIAKILGLSPKTIEYYIEEIKNKMTCKNKSEIIEKSIERGYIKICLPEIN